MPKMQKQQSEAADYILSGHNLQKELDKLEITIILEHNTYFDVLCFQGRPVDIGQSGYHS